jgi:hypothetical protein
VETKGPSIPYSTGPRSCRSLRFVVNRSMSESDRPRSPFAGIADLSARAPLRGTPPAKAAFRLSVWCGVIVQWCKHRFLHRCKRQCDGKCRGISWSRAASPVERRAEAGDCGGGIQVRCGSARRGASGRRDAEFSLPLAAGSSGRGFAQVLVSPADDGVAAPPVPAIEIEFASSVPMRIPAAVSPALAAAVVEALARR